MKRYKLKKSKIPKLITTFFTLLALLLPGVALANTTIFEDNFDSENGGTYMLNYSGFANWAVSDGTVDLIGLGSPYDFYPGNGLYVDLDGSTNNAGTITTSPTLFMTAGVYELSFDLGGNARSGSDDMLIVSVLLGGSYSEFFSLSASSPLTTINRSFTVATDSNSSLMFNHLGGDNIGMILDNVKISAVPEPSGLILLGVGLLGVIGYRRFRDIC